MPREHSRSASQVQRVSQAIRQIRAKPLLPVSGHKFFLLFLFLLGDLLLYPYVSETVGLRYYLIRSLGVAVTLVSVYAVSFRRGLIFIALSSPFPR